ncbi:hypothetical protein [Paracoccus marcusii]|uniref:hypothetical protein n=1 Tax=Paracoccus marcusii TaxID=59779 RepID=UPI002ED00673
MEHAAHALATLPGIDVLIAGHTHEVFPGPAGAAAPASTPIGNAGGQARGHARLWRIASGVIDLRFAPRADGALAVDRFAVRAESVTPAMPTAVLVARQVATAHKATLRQLSTRIGRTAQPLNSHFAVIGHDCGLRLVNLAQRWHVRQRLAGTPDADLPVLSASAPYRAGAGGPQHYTDVPAGTLSLRHLADLYPFRTGSPPSA